jgi:hypothetical protein
MTLHNHNHTGGRFATGFIAINSRAAGVWGGSLAS